MSFLTLLALALLVSIALAQSNICYANCRKGYCSNVNALSCSDCDPGLLNMNGNCITTNIQPAPLTFLKPNPANTLLDYSNYNVLSCKATSATTSGTTMVFQTQIGNSFTRQINIPTSYSFLRLKFNAILMTPVPISQSLSILVNLVPASNRRAFIKSQVETVSASGVQLSCNGTLPSIKYYYGVFFMDYSISNGNTSIISEIIPQGISNSYVAVSDFQLYYGNCYQTCASCVGPTESQCSSCRGLLITLNSSGTCVNCPAGFYQNITCWPCPVNCLNCSYANKLVTCTACRSIPPLIFTLAGGNCTLTQFSITTLTGQQLPFDTGVWDSNQVINSPISICGVYPLVGGVSIGVANSYLSYTANDLPSHSHIYLFFNLFLIDQTPMDTYQYMVKVDSSSQLVSFTIPNTNVTNECGGAQIQYLTPQSFNFPHNSSSALITIQIYKSFLGIRDFLIVVDNPSTDANCVVFANNTCQVCRNGLSVVNGTCSGCLDGFYLTQQNGLPFCLQCSFTCAKCSGANVCTACITPLTLDGTFCIDTNDNLRDAELLQGVPLQKQNISWTNYPNLQNRGIDTCGTHQIIGTSSLNVKFLTMNKLFTNLPKHTGALLYFNFYQIDDNYFPNNTLYFVLNGNTYTQDNTTNLRNLSQLQMSLCGNASADSSFVVQLKDLSHTGSTLDFSVHLTRMGKIGLNNIQLYLLNTTANNLTSYSVQMVPAYSVSALSNKGMEVKLKFNNQFQSASDMSNAFLFNVLNASGSRLLQEGYSNGLIAANSTISQKEILYLLNLTSDYNSSNQVQLRPASQSSVYFPTAEGQYSLVSQAAVTSPVSRYVNIDQSFVNDRSSMRNLFNLFRGCAILALFFGMGSFLLGMSAAFDDFFILCQVIFVHIFIQLEYNPPSLRVPFAGLHIVQFLEWLPDAARTGIQKAIIPGSFYQYTPLVYQQYYEDTVFARTIYHTILYFALFFGLWLLMHVIIRIYEAKYPNEETKYENYFIYFYKQYHSKAFVMVDKIVRFAYFTIVWACTLQFISFANSPQSFHIWNSILTVVLFIAAFVYPIIMFWLLNRNANRLTDATFGAVYEQVRVHNEKLYYYLVRYYKLFIIAVVVGVCYQTSPVAPLIILIFLHLVDFGLIIFLKPLGMVQAQLINATIFYPYYPKAYYYTTLIQQILFVFMQIFFLILVGIRNSASSGVYMGIGYTICAFVILLLLNGLVRLIWGVLKILQQCYLQREANYLSIEKQVHENDDNENNPIVGNELRTQGQLTLKDINSRMFTNKKMSYVSKLR